MTCLLCFQPLLGDDHYGLHNECFADWFNTSSKSYFTNLSQKTTTSDSAHATTNSEPTSFFHGKFKKYAASLEGKSFILKMREAEAPELPEVEYLCNQISTVVSLPVAKFRIINFHGDRVFVTENFINPTTPMDLIHIYHYLENSQYTCADLISVVKNETKQPHCVEALINTILFDALIGNHDRHGRNLALIVTSNNKVLAPIYDNVSYLALESGKMLEADFNPSGKIATEKTLEPSMRDYVIELKKLGYEDVVNQFYKKLSTRTMCTIEKLIEKSFCSLLMKNALKKLIQKRFLELENELKY